MNELEIYNNFDIQNQIYNNKSNQQTGGGNNDILNEDYITVISKNIAENNTIRKNIELNLCIYKQLNDTNKIYAKEIINKIKL